VKRGPSARSQPDNRLLPALLAAAAFGPCADDRAAKSLGTETGLPLQASITRDGPALYAGDDVGGVLSWPTLP